MIWINIFIAAALRLFNLGIRPFDGDEGIIIKFTQASWSDLFSQVAKDVHPPLYHVLVKITTVSGVNEWTVRIGSALLGIVSVYIIYLLAKQFFNKHIALLASFLAAISPYLLYPSQEARMYTLFLVLASLSYYLFFKLLKKISMIDAIGFIIASTLLLYTQYLGFVIITGQILYLLFRRDQYKFIKNWLIYYFLMGLFFIPQLTTMWYQFSSRVTEQSQSLAIASNLKGLIGAFYRFGAGRLFLDINPSSIVGLVHTNIWLFILFLISIIVPFGIFAYGKIKLYARDRKKFWLMFTPIAVACIATLFSTEIGSRASRYLIYIYPFYILVIGYGIFDFWPKWWGKILATVFIIISILGLYTHYTRDISSPGVDKIAEFISQNATDGDAVLVRGGFGGGETWILEYYLDKNSKEIPVYDMFGEYEPGNLSELKSVDPVSELDKLLENYDKIYFYDMTYETSEIPNSQIHNLGTDKENKPLIIWEVMKE